MSVYRRVHTPHSPLVPLSPMPPALSPSMYLSPYATSIRTRRSFTPNHLNVLSPPSVSPIERTKSTVKPLTVDKCTGTKRDESFNCTYILSSSKKSMKKARSNRKQEIRSNRSSLHVELTPIRRSLFSTNVNSPAVRIITPTSDKCGRLKTPTNRVSHKGLAMHLLTPASHRDECNQDAQSPRIVILTPRNTTPSLLEETFTVMSILKEIRMEKYANMFEREEVDLLVFFMLTKNDMDELGIDKEDQPILMNAIQCYTEVFGQCEKN